MIKLACFLVLVGCVSGLWQETNCSQAACNQGPCQEQLKLPDQYCLPPIGPTGSVLLYCNTPVQMTSVTYYSLGCTGPQASNQTLLYYCIDPDTRIVCSFSSADKIAIGACLFFGLVASVVAALVA